jgi:dephospho-CoA kinase
MLRGLGALVIDADVLAREAVAPGSPGLERIAEHWPAVVHDGELDRPALAQIVFHNEGERAALNAIVHPLVRQLAFEREADGNPDQLVVHEIPLLYESGFAAFCDWNVVVIAPREVRIARLLARGGMTQDDIESRMAAQIHPEEARSRSDFAIENDGTLEQLRERTQAIYAALLARKADARR